MEEKRPKRQPAAAKEPAVPKKAAPKKAASSAPSAIKADSPKKAATPRKATTPKQAALAPTPPVADAPKKAPSRAAKPKVQTVAPKKETERAASNRKSTVTSAPRPVKKAANKTPFWAPFAKKETPKPEKEREEREERKRPPRQQPTEERPLRSSKPERPRPPQTERNDRQRFSKPRPQMSRAPAPKPINPEQADEPMRLNKFLAYCGIAARRQSADFVKQGLVTVNGEVEPNPGYPVQPTDEVRYKGQVVKLEARKVYILMNKPKDIITTASDEKGRKTVLDIIGKKVEERIFPVGRLDRMTSGLLLLTNDGDLAKKLSHPSHKVQKVYHVTLDKPFIKNDFEKVQKGLNLEDGIAMVDSLHYVDGTKDELEIGIHIGKNRIVRRIFEHLGYEVVKLDRTYYAGLTKKDIGRGHFRHLTDKEVVMLKHFK